MGGFGGGGNANRTPRSGLVFVQKGDTWEARNLRLGVANYDVTEVVSSNLQEGEKVALLTAAILQANRQAQMDRQKSMQSPLGGGGGMPGGGPGGGAPRGGGGGRGG